MFSVASVCLCVCQHDNLRMIKCRMMKLGVRCILQKSRPSLNVKVKGQGHQITKNCGILSRSRPWGRCAPVGKWVHAV